MKLMKRLEARPFNICKITIIFCPQILSVVDFLHTEMNKKQPDFNLAQDYVFKVWMPEVCHLQYDSVTADALSPKNSLRFKGMIMIRELVFITLPRTSPRLLEALNYNLVFGSCIIVVLFHLVIDVQCYYCNSTPYLRNKVNEEGRT